MRGVPRAEQLVYDDRRRLALHGGCHVATEVEGQRAGRRQARITMEELSERPSPRAKTTPMLGDAWRWRRSVSTAAVLSCTRRRQRCD